MGRMHAPGEEKRSVVPIEQPDWLVWLASENHEELRGLLKLFDAELYEDWPNPKAPRRAGARRILKQLPFFFRENQRLSAQFSRVRPSAIVAAKIDIKRDKKAWERNPKLPPIWRQGNAISF